MDSKTEEPPISIKISLITFSPCAIESSLLPLFQPFAEPLIFPAGHHVFSIQFQERNLSEHDHYLFQEDGILYSSTEDLFSQYRLRIFKYKIPINHPIIHFKKADAVAEKKALESVCLWILARRQGVCLERFLNYCLMKEMSQTWLQLAQDPNRFTPREAQVLTTCHQLIADNEAEVVSIAHAVQQGTGYELPTYRAVDQARFLLPYLPLPLELNQIIYEYQPLNQFNELQPYLTQLKYLSSSVQGFFNSVYLMKCFQIFDFRSLLENQSTSLIKEKPALNYDKAQSFLKEDKMLQAMEKALAALSTRRHLSLESRKEKKQELIKFKNKYIKANLKEDLDSSDQKLKLSVLNFYTQTCKGRPSSWCSWFTRSGTHTASAQVFLKEVKQDPSAWNLLKSALSF